MKNKILKEWRVSSDVNFKIKCGGVCDMCWTCNDMEFISCSVCRNSTYIWILSLHCNSRFRKIVSIPQILSFLHQRCVNVCKCCHSYQSPTQQMFINSASLPPTSYVFPLRLNKLNAVSFHCLRYCFIQIAHMNVNIWAFTELMRHQVFPILFEIKKGLKRSEESNNEVAFNHDTLSGKSSLTSKLLFFYCDCINSNFQRKVLHLNCVHCFCRRKVNKCKTESSWDEERHTEKHFMARGRKY